jgi:ssDNA thymidine ADP-ribosyltransferase, DarT
VNNEIRAAVRTLGISRLCHFTPSRNLPHIINQTCGILATKHLNEDEKAVFNITDALRLDGRLDYISCSIEYPNAWYLRKAMAKESLFLDWVLLFISPDYLWDNNTEFCVRNAAAASGIPGLTAFQAMYAPHILGARNTTRSRGALHLACSPTDDQAEVQVFSHIAFEHIIAIGVRTAEQAAREVTRLKYLGVDATKFKFIIVPELFDAQALSTYIRRGLRPRELDWEP